MTTRTSERPPKDAVGPINLVPARTARGRSTAVIIYLVLIFFALLYIFPFLIQIGTSFKSDAEATSSPLNPIPMVWQLDAYRTLAGQDFPRWFLNSVIVSVCVTAGRVFFDSLAGYALARLHFFGRKALGGVIVSVIAVPGVVLLIPKYLVLVELHMYNTYAGMIIPLIADAAGVFIMRQFFLGIPAEVEEAARIDGAGTFRLFWSVVLPMARPAVITITILSFQASWNELAHFIVSRRDPALNTLTSGVASLSSGAYGSGNLFPLKMAAALLMTIPVALVFFSFQRYFVRGAGAGAVKG